MEIVFLEVALNELDEAIDYYEDQFKGLGRNFEHEVFYSLELISKHPLAWTKVSTNTRRCLINRFPYFILFIVEDELITVTAVGHQHRKPDYYSDRIS